MDALIVLMALAGLSVAIGEGASHLVDGSMLLDPERDPEHLASLVQNQERPRLAPGRRSFIPSRAVGHCASGVLVSAVWLALVVATNFSAIVVALGFLIALAVLKRRPGTTRPPSLSIHLSHQLAKADRLRMDIRWAHLELP
jgi:hypothetical protein